MFTTWLIIQTSFTFSSSSITIGLFNFEQSYFILGACFAPVLGAAKSVFPKLATRDSHIALWVYHNTEQGWGQVKYLYLVLGTWCKLSSTWYLLILDLFKFKSTWYLLVLDGQSTWYLSKYSSTFVKLTNIHVLVNNSPLNTISRNGSYWLCSQHGSQDVNSQDWTVSLSFRPSVETRWLNIDKILAIIGSGSNLSPVWCKPLQPNRYIVHWSL